MSQKIVFTGLLVETKKQISELTTAFKEQGFHAPKIVHKFRTLPTPGEPGTGGRTDVIATVNDKDVPKLAIHPWHLQGLFSWLEDYVDNNRSIIPPETLEWVLTNKSA